MADASVSENGGGWMADVQRALALILVGTFAIALMMLTVRVVIWGDPPTLIDLIKTLISALINVVMLVLGYFYGSSKAKETSDTSTQKVIEKLTSTQPPNGGPVAPVPAPPPPPATPWWTVLKDIEKDTITTAAGGDARIMAFVSAANLGRGTPEDLDYLVSKGLMTAVRAAEIKLV